MPRDQAEARWQEAGVVTAFMDPGMRRSARSYYRVIERLHASGMLNFVACEDAPEDVVERVGFFAAPKKK